MFNKFRADSLQQKWMTSCHMHDLLDHFFSKYLLTPKIGSRMHDKVTRLRWLQKTHFECLRIYKVTSPVRAHLAECLYATEEQGYTSTILDRTAEPIQQKIKIEVTGQTGFFELLKLIEK